MAFKHALAVCTMLALGTSAQAQTVAPDKLTQPMEFAGALVGAEIMLIEYSKSHCGPLNGRWFGVQQAVNLAAPYLSPSERQALVHYARENSKILHDEYQRLTNESLRDMSGKGVPLKDACLVLLNIYDKAYRTAKHALETAR